MDFFPPTEATYAVQFPEFFQRASKGEIALLMAIAHIQVAVRHHRSDSDAAETSQQKVTRAALISLRPQYSHLLRQTASWQRISESERDRLETMLLSDPENEA